MSMRTVWAVVIVVACVSCGKREQAPTEKDSAEQPTAEAEATPADKSEATVNTNVSLHLEEGQTGYVASGMAGLAISMTVVDGKMVYEPLPIESRVTSVFRGKPYEAVLNGAIESEAGSQPWLAPSHRFRGVVKGTIVVPGGLSWSRAIDSASPSSCRVLDEHPAGRYLVEGEVFFANRPLLIGPGCAIENARSDKAEISVPDASGKEHLLRFGERIAFDADGKVVE